VNSQKRELRQKAAYARQQQRLQADRERRWLIANAVRAKLAASASVPSIFNIVDAQMKSAYTTISAYLAIAAHVQQPLILDPEGLALEDFDAV
jgi:hypothetical protein